MAGIDQVNEKSVDGISWVHPGKHDTPRNRPGRAYHKNIADAVRFEDKAPNLLFFVI